MGLNCNGIPAELSHTDPIQVVTNGKGLIETGNHNTYGQFRITNQPNLMQIHLLYKVYSIHTEIKSCWTNLQKVFIINKCFAQGSPNDL